MRDQLWGDPRVNRYGTWPACFARSILSTYGEGIELSGYGEGIELSGYGEGIELSE